MLLLALTNHAAVRLIDTAVGRIYGARHFESEVIPSLDMSLWTVLLY